MTDVSEGPNNVSDQPPISDEEVRYLVFAMLSELHRQRELLALIAMAVSDEDKREKVQELLDRQAKQQYTEPFTWFSPDDT